jgi:chaperonin cofactor prefoldin
LAGSQKEIRGSEMAEITKKEFLELLQEFSAKTLDPKFEKIDSRFEKIDGQFKKVDSRFTEFREDIVHQFHLISEDVTSKVQQVAEGVMNLNEKLDRRMDGSERDHKDILSAIKFSYSELDKRISTLEKEMEDLKRRMENIERRSVS